MSVQCPNCGEMIEANDIEKPTLCECGAVEVNVRIEFTLVEERDAEAS